MTTRESTAPDWRAAEAAYERTPLVAEAAAVPLRPGARPWLVVRADEAQLREGRFVNIYEALRFRLETSALSLPVAARLTGLTLSREPLPRRADGSPDRDALLAAIGDPPPRVWPREPGRLTPVSPGWQAILRAVPALAAFSGPFAEELSLELDLALDSLDRLALIVAAGRALGVDVTDELVTSIYTIGDLVRELGPVAPGQAPAPAIDPEPSAVLRPEGGTRIPRHWLRPGGLGWPLVRVSRLLGKPLARRTLDLSVHGLERVDWSERPLLIAQNHQTHMDAVMLAAVLPPSVHRQLFFLGFSGYFAEGWGRWLGRIYRIYPISADDYALDGLRAGVAAADAGRIVCVYPEGERTWDGSIRPFRRGVAWLARETGARVVPATVNGAYQAWPRGRSFHAHPVSIRFDAPLDPPAAGSGREEERRFLGRLRESMVRLMGEAGYDPDAGDRDVWEHGPVRVVAGREAPAVGSGR